MSQTDAVIVEPVRVHPHELVDVAFAEVRAEIVALCRSIVGDEAEDVAQEAYLRARDKVSQLRDRERIAAWIAKIAINLCFGHRRRRERLVGLLPSLTQKDPDRNLDLEAAIWALPTAQRTVVVLYYGHGLDDSQISTLIDKRPGTVRSIRFRARARLRANLEDR